MLHLPLFDTPHRITEKHTTIAPYNTHKHAHTRSHTIGCAAIKHTKIYKFCLFSALFSLSLLLCGHFLSPDSSFSTPPSFHSSILFSFSLICSCLFGWMPHVLGDFGKLLLYVSKYCMILTCTFAYWR